MIIIDRQMVDDSWCDCLIDSGQDLVAVMVVVMHYRSRSLVQLHV